jgi:hypothetical protein
MFDTTKDIYAKQFEIFNAKPLRERFLLNLELTEFVRETTRRRILRQNPNFTAKELKEEIFRQFYDDYFTTEQINKILQTWEKSSLK